MTASRKRFTQEFKDELCREVINTSKPIKDVATSYGVGPETLRNWLVKYREANNGTEADLTVSERARLKELEREVQELRAETAFLKKAKRLLRAGAAVVSKYEYIDSQKSEPANLNSVVRMCRWLGVSTSGFYHWATRPQSATASRRQGLTARIEHFFEESEGTYGYRRIHADLAAEQTECSPELVRQIMRHQGLVACQPRPFRVTTEADAEAAAGMPDLVQRDFTADRPGVKFVGDITYIHTWQGFVYLATVIDCYSKKVVGWSIADHMRTELVADALKNAAATTRIEPDAIWHSDRGSVYTSAGFRALVAGLGMRSSMGRTGVCWDNSMAESFFSALKTERVYRTVYATKSQARSDVICYIEGFYNSRRRHSALGYRRPNEVHYGYQQPALAA
ncbi:IS3 family transposase [Arthrobacter sp. AL12]|uniref:IS3 family transposase n=1 Tax=Arthrobacter sp. AL12 TaxID=3042241 RepID=UPI00249CA835|nr:IS3 family transposase [Arthrobacter sp. AL12]MDI3214104.1 IS3 family transposase [Arthrobacter sp. AL12]